MISNPSYNSNNRSLQFDLESTILLNLGASSVAVLLDSGDKKSHPTAIHQQYADDKNLTGDQLFIKELNRVPRPQRELGEQLLTEIRREFPGQLVLHEKSGKFVESPDNFWVVRVQPRAKSLKIVIFGRPEEHKKYESIELKKDMAPIKRLLSRKGTSPMQKSIFLLQGRYPERN